MGLEEKRPPLVSFITWNRMGLTVRNLNALLKTTDDFELYITDSCSGDCTWEYILDISDSRIKSKTRLPVNLGPIYAVNYNLSKRANGQYFVAMDSDVNLHTPDWVSKFMEAFAAFPDAGLLGSVSGEYYERYRLPYIKHEKDSACYMEITRGFVEGCFQCFRPGLLDLLGYWCEECCMGDVEICHRIRNYTGYKAGYLPAVEIDQLQQVSCESCEGRRWCGLSGKAPPGCFGLRNEKYRNPQFRQLHGRKYLKCNKDMESGARGVYRASVHDGASLSSNAYDSRLAEENFGYYRKYSN